MNGREMAYIQEAFDTNWIAPLGRNVDEFEKEIAAFAGVGHATALSSGTAALHLAVKLAGVRRDDVVLCSDLTFSATVNPVSYESGVQVFVDSEGETWNMDPEALELAFRKYPRAKAVIVANLYGTPARLGEIKAICEKHGAPLIEDAAESLGALYKDRQTGSFGTYGVFSFNGNKIITTSGGGMLVSDDGEAVNKARFWATQSREKALHYQHSEIGYNYRMSNVVAGIGRGQMHSLMNHVERKKQIYERYLNAFSDLEPVRMNPYLSCSEPNFWLSCMTIDPACAVSPSDVITALDKENIESRPIWKPMHQQPVFKDRDFICLRNGKSVGEALFERGLCLPSDIRNSDRDMDRIIGIVRGLFGKN
jgi:dTDP-4-amino-4,6-dideoxygalactose transaminase